MPSWILHGFSGGNTSSLSVKVFLSQSILLYSIDMLLKSLISLLEVWGLNILSFSNFRSLKCLKAACSLIQEYRIIPVYSNILNSLGFTFKVIGRISSLWL